VSIYACQDSLFISGVSIIASADILTETAMPVTARQCLFCDAPATSREHIIPKWIYDLMRRTYPHTKAFELEIPGVSLWRGESTIRMVCAHCNEAWMSELENAVKPIISPAILAQSRVSLGRPEQAIVATWITKTVMLPEFGPTARERRERVPEPYFNQHDRSFLRQHLEPPDDVFIWLAEFGGRLRFSFHQDADILLPSKAPLFGSGRGYCSTMSIGNFAFQLFSARHRPLTGFETTLSFESPVPEAWQSSTVLIWPPNEVPDVVTWPPELAFDDQSFQALITRFRI
jgi:hypothetical protein